jgi:hypothetical protein
MGPWVVRNRDNVGSRIEVARTNGWTIFGLSPVSPVSPESSPLFEGLTARLAQDSSSPVIWNSNYWFEVEGDFAQLNDATGWGFHIPANFPRIGFSATGENNILRIDGEFNFSKPLNLQLEAWRTPTNLIDVSVSSFTAIRGIDRWLDSRSFWQRLKIGPPPDQAFFWGLRGLQMQTYFAAPVENASNQVYEIAEKILQKGGPYFATNDLAKFDRSTYFNGIEWRGLPYLWPFLQSLESNSPPLIYAGLFPNAAVDPISPEALSVLNNTNLVYYDWEVTADRVQQWLYICQFARMVSQRPQLSSTGVSVAWIEAIIPKLTRSLTQITITGPAQLSLVRKSSIGLTGIELQLLADWLESPQFPIGLYTFSSPQEQAK